MAIEKPRIPVFIPTFEPHFEEGAELLEYYTANFDSYLDPDGPRTTFIVFCDFASSEPYKSFLRSYVASRPNRAVLLDGAEKLGSFQALNMGFRTVPYGDCVAHAASDTRARDGSWLRRLLSDFDDTSVVATFSSNPLDASTLVHQLQPEPLDKPSRIAPFPKLPTPNQALYSRKMLEPFGHRLADMQELDCETGIRWQIEATGACTVNFRCNVLHRPFHDSGRYDRGLDHHWHLESREFDNFVHNTLKEFLPIPSLMLKKGMPFFMSIIRNECKKTPNLRGFLRGLYISFLRSQPRYVYRQIHEMGFINYLTQGHRAKSARARFHRLPKPAAVRLLKALYFLEDEFYNTVTFKIVGHIDGLEDGLTRAIHWFQKEQSAN